MRMARLARLALALLACSLLVALTACAAPPAGPLQLTRADNGTKQSAAVGQTIRIALDANPTTGYSWAVDGSLPSQLAEQGQPAYTAKQAGVVGGGGTQTLTFKATAAGDAALKLKYARSFEPTATPPSTFSVAIHIQ